MSYILNALRKSEQERQEGSPQTLENRIHNKQSSSPGKTPVWVITLVLVNLFLLFFFIWSFSKQENEGEINKAVVSEQKQKTIEKPSLKVKNKLAPAIKNSKAPQQQSIAEQIKNKNKSKNKKAKVSAVVKAPVAPVLETNNPIQVVKQASKLLPPTPPVIKPQIKTKKIISKAKNLDKQTNDIPYLSALDYNFRRAVPEVEINVYVYSENKQDRFIMSAMKKYRAGQRLDSGIILKEIGVNSLVVEYKGRVFQIKRK